MAMKEGIELQNTYVPEGHQFRVGIAKHNVEDLVELDDVTERIIKAKYGQRPGHIPRPTEPGGIEGILIQDPTSVNDPIDRELAEKGYATAVKHVGYIAELSGDSNRFTVFTPDTLKDVVDTGEEVVVAPYLRNGKLTAFMTESGLDQPNVYVSGMHPVVVHELKSKASFHDRVREEGDPDFAVPHHIVVPVDEVAHAGDGLIKFTDELYDAIGVERYPTRIFGRLDYSDGGFGSFNVKRVDNGGYQLDTGGGKHPLYDDLDDALEAAQNAMLVSSKGDGTTKVVLSRGLDLVDTPGLSMFFADGEAVPLGFNGQILDPDSKACIGTSNYDPADPRLISVHDEYADQIAQAAVGTVHAIAREKGVPVTELRGFTNADAMVLGDKELVVQQRVTEALKRGTLPDSLVAKLEQYGQLPQPAKYFMAESNPRRTNLIEAIDEVILVEGLDQTVKSMKQVLDKGIMAIDSYPLPPGVDVDTLADALGETYAKDVREDGIVILRMRPIEELTPDKPSSIGVIMTGDITKRKKELDELVHKVQKKPGM